MDGCTRFVPARTARATLGVCDTTLRDWARRGRLACIHEPGAQRLYAVDDFINARHKNAETIQTAPSRAGAGRGIIYARVSSAHQKDDLKRQVAALRARYPDYEAVTDVASGINFRRRGLSFLVECCVRGRVPEVVVAHRDRLARFGFELVETVLRLHGTRLTVLDADEHAEPSRQLAEDLMSIVQVFACRRNGKRRYGRGGRSGAQTASDQAHQGEDLGGGPTPNDGDDDATLRVEARSRPSNGGDQKSGKKRRRVHGDGSSDGADARPCAPRS